ncbi:MAG: hypothetical protein AAF432_05445, partial [Planctomycetota bacterium]
MRDPQEVLRELYLNTERGVLSRIWYDKELNEDASVRIIEPKRMVEGRNGPLVRAYQREPKRGVRHFMVHRIVRVSPVQSDYDLKGNNFCSGEVVILASIPRLINEDPKYDQGFTEYVRAVESTIID